MAVIQSIDLGFGHSIVPCHCSAHDCLAKPECLLDILICYYERSYLLVSCLQLSSMMMLNIKIREPKFFKTYIHT
jgi:hypothetical protein